MDEFVVKWSKNRDYLEYLQRLLDGNYIGESSAQGITKMVIDGRIDELSEKQWYVFLNEVDSCRIETCNRCGTGIPWAEMLDADINGGFCGHCASENEKDD